MASGPTVGTDQATHATGADVPRAGVGVQYILTPQTGMALNLEGVSKSGNSGRILRTGYAF